MPLIEVYATWRDENDVSQRQFVASVQSPAEGLREMLQTGLLGRTLAPMIDAAHHVSEQQVKALQEAPDNANTSTKA